MMPSRTSLLVATARAFGTREPDPILRNPDYLAERLIGPEERALIEPHPLARALDDTYEAAMEQAEVAGLVRLMMLRTRFIDDGVRRAIERGARQVVILGAGMDTRAYRFRESAGVRFFELDTAETQAYKRSRMSAIGVQPDSLVYAPIDFRVDSATKVLDAAGFDRALPTVFVWEGVSMYLPEENIRATLAELRAMPHPENRLIMDYTSRESIALLADAKTPHRRYAGGWGETWIFGIPEGTAAEFFGSAGYDVVESLRLASAEATARYSTRPDGTIVGASAGDWTALSQGARRGYAMVELRLRT